MMSALLLLFFPLYLVLPIVVDELYYRKLIDFVRQNYMDCVEQLCLYSHLILTVAHVLQFFESVYQLLFKSKIK